MEKPEIQGINAVACIFDPVLAAGVVGTAGTMAGTIALSCNVVAVIGILGAG